ncbi:Ion transport domain [Trinorchestia longiramus]|nr:Ion transport domain [Trinorchestia longiramus]
MACINGHTNVVGLLLSKSAKQVHIADKKGRTGLHIAATHGHYDMVALLLGQGVELGAKDRVIAHPSVQRYLNDVWMGSLKWPAWKMAAVFLACLVIPPIWLFFSLPLRHKYYRIPFTKFLSYLVSHCYMLLLMILMVVTPLSPIWELTDLMPRWHEWMLLAWLSGNLVAELTSPGDRTGLGWIKVFVLMFGGLGVLTHVFGFLYYGHQGPLQEILYVRNVLIGCGLLLATVQLLDFLSFHNLFGPWAVIIGKLMVDLGRFLVILAIFMFGFTMYLSAIYNPIRPIYTSRNATLVVGSGYPPFEAPVQDPVSTAELLFFSLFGLVEPDYMPPFYSHPFWAKALMKLVFGVYQMVTVVVLINLLIAMMSDTYQRIHAKSDIEWKYGLAKLIRNMSRTSGTPSPLNLLLKFAISLVACCKFRGNLCSEDALDYIRKEGRMESAHAIEARNEKRFAKRLSKSRGSIAPQSTENLVQAAGSTSELGGEDGDEAIKSVTDCVDWTHVVKRYREKKEKDSLTAKNAQAGGGELSLGTKKDGDKEGEEDGDEKENVTDTLKV